MLQYIFRSAKKSSMNYDVGVVFRQSVENNTEMYFSRTRAF